MKNPFRLFVSDSARRTLHGRRPFSPPRGMSMDYNSRDGMVTFVWGPAMWHFLHTVSFNYPPEPDDATKRAYWDTLVTAVWASRIAGSSPLSRRDDHLLDIMCAPGWTPSE